MTTNYNLKDIDPKVFRAYRSGWNAAARGTSLETADARGYSDAWYDGYSDFASGHEKYHRLFCVSMTGHDACLDTHINQMEDN